MVRIALALILLASPLLSGAQQPPIAFKDLVLGQPLPSRPLDGKLDCAVKKDSCSYTRMEGDKLTFAGRPIEGVSVELLNNAVHAIFIFVPESGFRDVKAAFAERYQPMRCSMEKARPEFDIQRAFESCRYEDNLGSLRLNQMSLLSGKSAITIRTHEYVKRTRREGADAK